MLTRPAEEDKDPGEAAHRERGLRKPVPGRLSKETPIHLTSSCQPQFGFNLPNCFGVGKTVLGKNSQPGCGRRASPCWAQYPSVWVPPTPLACCILHLCCFEPTSRTSPQPPEGQPQRMHPPSLHSPMAPTLPASPHSHSGQGDPAPFRAMTAAQSHSLSLHRTCLTPACIPQLNTSKCPRRALPW